MRSTLSTFTKPNHGTGAAAHFDEAAINHVGGTQFPAQGAGKALSELHTRYANACVLSAKLASIQADLALWSDAPNAQKAPRSFSAVKTCWRRERDSNPRYGFPHSGFQDRLFQPLTHPSA